MSYRLSAVIFVLVFGGWGDRAFRETMKNSYQRALAAIFTLIVCLFTVVHESQGVPWKLSYKEGEQMNLQQVSLKPEPGRQIFGTFWSMQRTHFPPLPCYPMFLSEAGYDVPVYALDAERGIFLVDDRAVDYEAIYAERERKKQELTLLRSLEFNTGLMSIEEFSLLEGEGGGMAMMMYSGSDLWIEIVKVENDYAYLTLHGTVENLPYQLLSKTNLVQTNAWKLGEIINGAAGTNQTDFSQLYVAGITNQFFKAHHAKPIVSVFGGNPGFEANSLIPTNTPGLFSVTCSATNDVTVHYQMSGMAGNGVDYTNLTGAVTIPANSSSLYVYFWPKTDNVVEGSESVIMTILQDDGYLIYPGSDKATNFVWDASDYFTPTTFGSMIETNGPPGAPAENGQLYIQRDDQLGYFLPVTVYYSMSGTASNGVDYELLSGVVNFAQNETSKQIDVITKDDLLVEGVEMVAFTLIPTNTYTVLTNDFLTPITIIDTTTKVGVQFVNDGREPNTNTGVAKITGQFSVVRDDTRNELPALTVSYQLSGSATNNVDYTNMAGTVMIPAGLLSTAVYIEPLYDGLFDGDETVTITLTKVNDHYLINSILASATLVILDNDGTNKIQTVANINRPCGIDYHPPTDSLIVSPNHNSGLPVNFVRVSKLTTSTNVLTVVSNWSGLSGDGEEIKLVTVKATGNGFTNGTVFFGSGTNIGWISPTGNASNKVWGVLTNVALTNTHPLRGSLCMDETGLFSNSVIAVASSPGATSGFKGVWAVNSNRQTRLIASIGTAHLEGVIVMTNNVAKWGPWAGKILTGDEMQFPPPLYTISTNGAVTTNDTTQLFPGGIQTEDFEVIPPNQDYYACDLFGSKLLKVSRDYFTNYVGDLLILDAGDGGSSSNGKIYVLKWDVASNSFLTRRLLSFPGPLEHATFAPVNLPPLTP